MCRPLPHSRRTLTATSLAETMFLINKVLNDSDDESNNARLTDDDVRMTSDLGLGRRLHDLIGRQFDRFTDWSSHQGNGESHCRSDSSRSMRITFGKKGHSKGQFHMPCGVATNSKGDIIVADTENHRIQIFTANGHLQNIIGSKGSLPYQLNHPMTVAVTSDTKEHIVVTDSVNSSVKVFQHDGTYVTQYGEDKFFDFPYGLAIARNNYIIVTDICRHCVVVLYPSGQPMTEFGGYGDGIVEFDHPHFVAVDSQFHIIVCDSGNTSIKLFSFEGHVLMCFTMNDFRLFQEHFVILQGITVDSDGNILVIGNSTVYIVAPNGRLWEVLLPRDGLHSPKNLVVSSLGDIVVTQCGEDNRHEVTVFAYTKSNFDPLKSHPFMRPTHVCARQLEYTPDVRQRTSSKRGRSSASTSSMEDDDNIHLGV